MHMLRFIKTNNWNCVEEFTLKPLKMEKASKIERKFKLEIVSRGKK